MQLGSKNRHNYVLFINKLCIFGNKMMQNLVFPIENNVNGLMYKRQNKRCKLLRSTVGKTHVSTVGKTHVLRSDL